MPFDIPRALRLLTQHHQENILSQEPRALYDPRDYIMNQSGKKMRSLLCLMGYDLYQQDIESMLDLAYCVELFHNFSLVHDDIMDEAELRRGNPAVHAKFGRNAAILTGDVMLIEVYERLTQIEDVDQLEVIKIFNAVAREVCDGQSMDMTFETQDKVTIAEYLEMIKLKTAVLLGLSLRLGATKGGASESDQNHLYEFGVNAGISFQLQDDYLDVYGDPKKFGKKVGGDIIQGKKTYLYLRALELLHEDDRNEFIKFYADQQLESADKVSRVRSIFDELHIPVYCQEAKESFFGLANSHLDVVNIAEEKKEDLRSFALQLMNRNS